MKKIITSILISFTFTTAYAGPTVVDGDAAKSAYENRSASEPSLVQRLKNFLLDKDGEEVDINRQEITVKAGTPLYIVNDEKRYVHNIYDANDKSWVIKKQKPKTVSVVTYNEAGTHKLRCAIHPKMRVTVNVE